MKGRKNGCPVNIKNWLIEVLDKATDEFVRVFGMNSLEATTEGETADSSSDTDDWKEPYITKRSGKSTMSGKPVCVESTGIQDRGQEILDEHSKMTGCDADATMRFTDPYGHRWVGDYVITNRKESANNEGMELSYDMEQVGEVEVLPYKHVSSITLKDGDNTASALAFNVGDAAKIITIVFAPEDASNKRFKVSNTKRSVASVSNITDTGFTITAVEPGTTTVTVTTVNGAKTASIVVTVTAGA